MDNQEQNNNSLPPQQPKLCPRRLKPRLKPSSQQPPVPNQPVEPSAPIPEETPSDQEQQSAPAQAAPEQASPPPQPAEPQMETTPEPVQEPAVEKPKKERKPIKLKPRKPAAPLSQPPLPTSEPPAAPPPAPSETEAPQPPPVPEPPVQEAAPEPPPAPLAEAPKAPEPPPVESEQPQEKAPNTVPQETETPQSDAGPQPPQPEKKQKSASAKPKLRLMKKQGGGAQTSPSQGTPAAMPPGIPPAKSAPPSKGKVPPATPQRPAPAPSSASTSAPPAGMTATQLRTRSKMPPPLKPGEISSGGGGIVKPPSQAKEGSIASHLLGAAFLLTAICGTAVFILLKSGNPLFPEPIWKAASLWGIIGFGSLLFCSHKNAITTAAAVLGLLAFGNAILFLVSEQMLTIEFVSQNQKYMPGLFTSVSVVCLSIAAAAPFGGLNPLRYAVSLVAAALGIALFLIFGMKEIHKELPAMDSTSGTGEAVSENNTPIVSGNMITGQGYSLEFPKNWRTAPTPANHKLENSRHTFSFVSPDKNTTVTLVRSPREVGTNTTDFALKTLKQLKQTEQSLVIIKEYDEKAGAKKIMSTAGNYKIEAIAFPGKNEYFTIIIDGTSSSIKNYRQEIDQTLRNLKID